MDDIKSLTLSNSTTTLPVSVGALVDVDFFHLFFFFGVPHHLFSMHFCSDRIEVDQECQSLSLSPSSSNSPLNCSHSSLSSFFFLVHTPAYVHSDHTQISGRLLATAISFLGIKNFPLFSMASYRMRAIASYYYGMLYHIIYIPGPASSIEKWGAVHGLRTRSCCCCCIWMWRRSWCEAVCVSPSFIFEYKCRIRQLPAHSRFLISSIGDLLPTPFSFVRLSCVSCYNELEGLIYSPVDFLSFSFSRNL